MISREDVEHVAALARLGLTDEEIDRMQGQLNRILEAVGQAAGGGHQRVGPTAQVIALENVMRDDVARPSHVPRGGPRQRAAARRRACCACRSSSRRAARAGGPPTTLPLADRTITEVGALLRAREVSSRELTEACLARIERDAERLNTFLAVGAERALAAADAADAALAAATGRIGRCSASRTR